MTRRRLDHQAVSPEPERFSRQNMTLIAVRYHAHPIAMKHINDDKRQIRLRVQRAGPVVAQRIPAPQLP